MDVPLIKGEPHFTGVNFASFAVSTIRKCNVLVTKGVLDKVEHVICNPDPTTGAMWAFKVTAFTDPLNDQHVITMPPTTVTVSQKVCHGHSVKRKMSHKILLTVLPRPSAPEVNIGLVTFFKLHALLCEGIRASCN
jgi:hypothetical protein